MHIVMNGKSIKDWREEERPREKMLERGVSALTDAELLAILLRTGSREKSALDLARELLDSAENSLKNLSNYSTDSLTGLKGVGKTKAVTLIAAFEAGRRSLMPAAEEGALISDAKCALEVMAPILSNLDHEECWAIFLNRANRVISKERLSSGGVSSTTLDVKMIVKRAVEKLAGGIILMHNHPSGNAAPGKRDIQETQTLKKAAQLLDIALLDHIIVAGNRYYSFSEEEYRRR